MKSIRIAVITAALATVSSSAFANLILNGCFESGTNPNSFTTVGLGGTNIDSWSVLAGNIDYIGTHWQAADGVRSVDLNGGQPGTIGQTFATVVGQQYAVRFAVAGNPDGGPAIKALVAAAGGTTSNAQFDTTGKTRTNMGWQYFDFLFTATSASTQLSFASQTGAGATCGACYGPALDDVSVNAVPEPVTALLLGAGLIATYHRRRR